MRSRLSPKRSLKTAIIVTTTTTNWQDIIHVTVSLARTRVRITYCMLSRRRAIIRVLRRASITSIWHEALSTGC